MSINFYYYLQEEINMNKVLAKYNFLEVKKGFDMDTITVNAAKTGLELSREDIKYIINKVYEELIGINGYMSIEKMGTMIVLRKW